MIEWFRNILSGSEGLFDYVIIAYAGIISLSYVVLIILAAFSMRRYKLRNSFVDYQSIFTSPHAPGVSLIAPAYNEGKSIVENVRSLLTLNYPVYEVVIVNDGSTDDTLSQLIEEYQLQPVDYCINNIIPTNTIKTIYKPLNPAYKKLIVVDKENGGKADALNVGVNISSHELVACIDVDCVLEYDALLKLVKPFMESNRRVIATGGVIRIANSCVVKDGKLVEVNLPDSFIARVEVLEYIRAFLIGRMAWAGIDGLMLISGAFGMFDKEILIKAGGYNHNTVGEDLELVVRMRRYMYHNKIESQVSFIPDPLCWTEAPQTWKVFLRQRNRWTRGTAETLWLHRRMFLNPKYGRYGLLSVPYWLMFEWLAPLMEAAGIIFFLILAIFGIIDWRVFLSFLALIYSFALMFSVAAILFEEKSYQQYKKPKQVIKLVLTAMLEPLFYHPVTVWAAIMGNIDLQKGTKSWGEMTREGFSGK